MSRQGACMEQTIAGRPPQYELKHVSDAAHHSESRPEVCDGVGLLPASAPGPAQVGVPAAFEVGAGPGADSGAASVGRIGVLPCGHQEGDLVD